MKNFNFNRSPSGIGSRSFNISSLNFKGLNIYGLNLSSLNLSSIELSSYVYTTKGIQSVNRANNRTETNTTPVENLKR